MTTTVQRGAARSTRADQTRAGIVAAARDAFVTHGYRATSLRDVAAVAGISHPGLLRHFATKDELLAAVVADIEEQNENLLLQRVEADEPGTLDYTEVARHNAEIPGYLALFSALNGEASASLHPAHDRMRERYTRLIELSSASIEEAIIHNVVDVDRDPHGEAVRLAAAWDGLQLLEQYLPERVSVIDALERQQEFLSLPVGWRDPGEAAPRTDPAPVPGFPALGGPAEPEVGYRPGRERRARIIADATALFAAEGYADTSLRDIAAKVGVSKSTLLHHYPSKEELLSAVLRERDQRIDQQPLPVGRARAAEELRQIPAGAARSAATTPGLIEVYAVLSCEALPADHPAHAYFEDRFTRVIDYFAELLRLAQADGDLPSHRDPEFEAIWLVALWDGLQYQWLYDRDSVDIAAHLTAHLDDVLPRTEASED
ncbi:TetR family transcriptional regulator [Microbacterium sp. Root61]|uniref:TetR/AcrR family transcriptional regulator n=1 Tax=Microbacterium sp. Root61 TaxID=1736570 RepID=UPI0006F9464C|nr:TetR/AcrR family transcriptional regulator [Microbacterium sp. Root61]KRA26053.1 TetR family transcriptional regulator [Microbacterium sp. Root61]